MTLDRFMRASDISLPNQLQRELNGSGPGHQRLLQATPARYRAVRIEYLGVARAKKRQGRREVGVIQGVEELRPKLHGGSLLDGEVFQQRGIDGVHIRADNAVAAGVAQKIRATARDLGKGHALRCDFGVAMGTLYALGLM